MRTPALLLGAVVVCGALLAGAATAAPTGPDSAHNSTALDNSTNESGQVGICVVGVDSPCNGEQWDGEDEQTVENDSATARPPTNDSGGEGQMGVCVVGADSPCNGEQWDGDGQNSSTAVTRNTTANDSEGQMGVCRVGVDSPCNGEQWDGDRPARTNESTTERGSAVAGPPESDTGGQVGICMVGADSPCNSDRWASVPIDWHAVPGGDVLSHVLRMVTFSMAA